MSKPDLCPGGGIFIANAKQVPASPFIRYVWDFYYFIDRRRLKRIRLKCPICGRRIMSSVRLGHDEDYIAHTLPPHKKKGWWKRKERSKK